MLIKLVNATADILKEQGYTRLELQVDSTGGHEATYYTAEGCERMGLGATVSDGWEDIATARKDEMILGHADGMVRLVMCVGGRWVQVGATIELGWFEPTEWKPIGPLPAPPSD